MNYLLEIDQLANRYFAMRHGHSLANAQGIIVSHPENGCDGYGLSKLGQMQVKRNLRQDRRLGADTLIVSSDFKRARESAEIAHSVLNCRVSLCTESRLRERNFGELELTEDSGYDDVWREDAINPDSQLRGVESVNQVMTRVSLVVTELEDRYSDVSILLISHGDALQILQTAFGRQDASSHRQLEHLQTAEVRQLTLV